MDIKAIEDYLRQVRSVIHSKILLDDDGSIKEMHIVCDSKRSPKQVSRDIQSVLVSGFGIDIDYKKISIAQIDCGAVSNSECRIKIHSIDYNVNGVKLTVKVILEYEDNIFEGVCSGPNTQNNCLRMVGKSTLQAIEKCIDAEEKFSLEDIKICNAAGREFVLAAVIVFLDGREWVLSGSSVVENDSMESVVKAVLDSLNRVLPKL